MLVRGHKVLHVMLVDRAGTGHIVVHITFTYHAGSRAPGDTCNANRPCWLQGTWWYRSIKYSAEQILMDTTQLYFIFLHKTPNMMLKRTLLNINKCDKIFIEKYLNFTFDTFVCFLKKISIFVIEKTFLI